MDGWRDGWMDGWAQSRGTSEKWGKRERQRERWREGRREGTHFHLRCMGKGLGVDKRVISVTCLLKWCLGGDEV